MATDLKIAPELQARVDAAAASSGWTPAEVVADALEHGLGWHEEFVSRIRAGIEAADAGDFATDADFEELRARYRPT